MMEKRKAKVVWLMNCFPPYRSSICDRVREEIPQIELIAAVTHDPREGNRWPIVPPAVVRQVLFESMEQSGTRSRVKEILDFSKARRVLRWLRQERPAAILVYGYDDATRLLTIAWAAAAGTPVFLAGDSNIKGDHARGLRRLLKSTYLRLLLPWVQIALPHGSLGTLYFRRYGVPARRIRHFPLEPDYKLIATEAPRRAAAIAARLHLRPDRRRIIYSGRLVSVKRVDLLVRAFNRVAFERPEWDLLVLGDGPERERLSSLIDASLTDRVQFAPSMGEPADVFAAYHACDVLVLPSDFEPWALVVNEAAASGLALICSDVVGAAADLLRDGVNGRLFRTGDIDDLVRALRDVCDPANLQRYKAASPGVVAEWRRKSDPIDGLRSALKFAGVI